MPRANRFHLPGYFWHLTHRRHHGDFLLKFARDRRLWVSWLFPDRRLWVSWLFASSQAGGRASLTGDQRN